MIISIVSRASGSDIAIVRRSPRTSNDLSPLRIMPSPRVMSSRGRHTGWNASPAGRSDARPDRCTFTRLETDAAMRSSVGGMGASIY